MTSKKNHPGIGNGRRARWLRENKITGQQFGIARDLLMTGPSATPPTWRAIRKMIGRLRRGDMPGRNGWSPWRSARAV